MVSNGKSRSARASTVILAAGCFPKRGSCGWVLLKAAKRVVACDSAADDFHRHFGCWPDVVIGDLDSFPPSKANKIRDRIVHVADQNTNDLTKAIDYCRLKRWRNLVIVGATGKREDHTIGNVFRALSAGVRVVTDEGTFYPVTNRLVLSVTNGSSISIFAPDPSTRVLSKGLQWPLDKVKFENLYCATLNRAIRSRITIQTNRPLMVFVTAF